MSTLTKEYLDEQLDKRIGGLKKDLGKQIGGLKKELKDHTEKQVNNLARIVADGFKQEREYFDDKIDRLVISLDVREEVKTHEKRIRRVEHAVGL